jgi:hypothetical protein
VIVRHCWWQISSLFWVGRVQAARLGFRTSQIAARRPPRSKLSVAGFRCRFRAVSLRDAASLCPLKPTTWVMCPTTPRPAAGPADAGAESASSSACCASDCGWVAGGALSPHRCVERSSCAGWRGDGRVGGDGAARRRDRAFAGHGSRD